LTTQRRDCALVLIVVHMADVRGMAKSVNATKPIRKMKDIVHVNASCSEIETGGIAKWLADAGEYYDIFCAVLCFRIHNTKNILENLVF
jgi:hypothetical protein